MWWALGVAIWLLFFVVVLSLCRAADEADRKTKGATTVRLVRKDSARKDKHEAA
jgi:hypothetical protein